MDRQAVKPIRVQLSRQKGFNLQATSLRLNGLTAVNCARPSKWGNQFVPNRDGDRPTVIKRFIKDFEGRVWTEPNAATARKELRGKNLACYCPLDQPCHCDYLLEVANK